MKEQAKQHGNHNLATEAKEAEKKCQSGMCYISTLHYWEQEAHIFYFLMTWTPPHKETSNLSKLKALVLISQSRWRRPVKPKQETGSEQLSLT